MTHPLQWFLDRIGKRIYRTSFGCKCDFCENVVENGIVIADVEQATEVWEYESISQSEGGKLRYADTKEELT